MPRTSLQSQPRLRARRGAALPLPSTPSLSTPSLSTPFSAQAPSSSDYPSSFPGELPPWSQAYSSQTPAPPPDPPTPFFSHTMSNQNAQRTHDAAPAPGSSATSNATTMVPETPQARPPTWTLDQNALLFNIALEKAEHDLQHEKRKAAAEEAGWTTSIISVRARPAAAIEEDEYAGEIPIEVKALATQFAGLPQGEIAKIFSNRFRPMNLYKLRLMGGRDDLYREQIHIDEGTLKMRKVTGSYKDYGTSNTLWSEAFLNYTMILMALFGPTIPSLYLALAGFHREIIELSTIYEWQGGVLPLALDFHTHVVEGQPTDPTRWLIPAKWQARFCNPLTALGSDASGQKRKRAHSPTPASKKDANDISVTCISFNKGVCSRSNCHRKHVCETCGGKDHGSRTCKKVVRSGGSQGNSA